MREKGTIIWTVYFDNKLTRREGRRLPLRLCVKRPSLSEVETACRGAGLEIKVIKAARYPRCWWIEGGYVVLNEVIRGKRDILRAVAAQLRRIRGIEESR